MPALPVHHLQQSDSKYRLKSHMCAKRLIALSLLSGAIGVFIVHAWIQSHRAGSSPTKQAQPARSVQAKQPGPRRVAVPYDPRMGAAVDPKETVDPEEEPFDKLVVFDQLVPPSTISCTGRNATDRVCRVKNLCFDPARNTFFIVKAAGTIIEHGKAANDTRLVDGSSLDGHNRFFIDYVEVDPGVLAGKTVHWVDRLTFVVSRFHRFNIMHSLHDDFLGLFNLAKTYAPANRHDPTAPFSLDTHIFFADWYGREHYDFLYRMISVHPPQYRSQWQAEAAGPLCFADAVVGNSKLTTWYNYGFLEPQSPIPGKQVSGLLVRDAAAYIMRRLGIARWNEQLVRACSARLYADFARRLQHGSPQPFEEPWDDQHFVTIFVRQRDRLIVNLKEVELALARTYGLPVRQVRMEDQTLGEQLVVLRSTVVAVGLHGSALILAMFMPPGATLVELFPFAVPPENYTPYKTLASLAGMRMIYKAWRNSHRENNRPHPGRQKELGGIAHLDGQEQERIERLDAVPPHLCCRNPVWLYRIYQDTVVHIAELIRTIDEGLVEAHGLLGKSDRDYVTLMPSAPDHVYCQVQTRHPLGSREAFEADENPLDMYLTWSKPWNGIMPAGYGVWVHQHYREFRSEGEQLVLEECAPGSVYDFWVRPYGQNGEAGVYTVKYQCSCALGAHIVKGSQSNGVR